MIKPVRLDEEAESEIDAAVDWYEERKAGLGLELLAETEEAKRRLAQTQVLPEQPARERAARRAGTSRRYREIREHDVERLVLRCLAAKRLDVELDC
jgi:plasmid stabilization system protein ParE